jgi:hypothetical protein
MCTPEAALIAGSVLEGTGAFIGATVQAESLEFQGKVAENRARMLDIQANDALVKGESDAVQIRKETASVVASQIAQTAGAGVDVGGATAREVFESGITTGIADELELRRNTRKQVWALRTEAVTAREEAAQLKKAAKITKRVAPIAFLAPTITGGAQAGLLAKQGST